MSWYTARTGCWSVEMLAASPTGGAWHIGVLAAPRHPGGSRAGAMRTAYPGRCSGGHRGPPARARRGRSGDKGDTTTLARHRARREDPPFIGAAGGLGRGVARPPVRRAGEHRVDRHHADGPGAFSFLLHGGARAGGALESRRLDHDGQVPSPSSVWPCRCLSPRRDRAGSGPPRFDEVVAVPGEVERVGSRLAHRQRGGAVVLHRLAAVLARLTAEAAVHRHPEVVHEPRRRRVPALQRRERRRSGARSRGRRACRGSRSASGAKKRSSSLRR